MCLCPPWLSGRFGHGATLWLTIISMRTPQRLMRWLRGTRTSIPTAMKANPMIAPRSYLVYM